MSFLKALFSKKSNSKEEALDSFELDFSIIEEKESDATSLLTAAKQEALHTVVSKIIDRKLIEGCYSKDEIHDTRAMGKLCHEIETYAKKHFYNSGDREDFIKEKQVEAFKNHPNALLLNQNEYRPNFKYRLVFNYNRLKMRLVEQVKAEIAEMD